jgi:hypothetical protein
MENVHFHGGRYGIVTEKTSPAWQFTLLDSSFDGQRDAAIREHEVDLTLVNVAMREHVPVGIEIDRGYSDSLWGKNVRFENVSKAASSSPNETSVFTQVGFDNAVAPTPRCSPASATAARPWPARARLSGRVVQPWPDGARPRPDGRVQDRCRDRGAASAPPAPRAGDPRPAGGGGVDQRQGAGRQGRRPDRRHRRDPEGDRRPPRALFPGRLLQGWRHPQAAAGHGADRPASGDDPVVHPRRQSGPCRGGGGAPIVETPRGGDNIVSGLGLFTGRVNPRASALLWRSAASLVEDVKIMGGGGTPTADGKPLGAAAAHSGDPVADGRWDAQYPSIWVTGWRRHLRQCLEPQHLRLGGLLHLRHQHAGPHLRGVGRAPCPQRDRARQRPNWEFLAPQTEQEVGDGPDASRWRSATRATSCSPTITPIG